MKKLAVLGICYMAMACGGSPQNGNALAAQPEEGVVAYPEDALQVEPAQPVRLPPLSVCLYDVGASDDVLAGVTAWAEALKPWRDIVIADSGCNLTIYEVGQHAGLCKSDDAAGCTTQIGGLEQEDPSLDLFLYRGNYEELATGATMHEIGHLLGLTHTESGLMKPNMDRGSEWTTPDEATLEKLSKLLNVDL